MKKFYSFMQLTLSLLLIFSLGQVNGQDCISVDVEQPIPVSGMSSGDMDPVDVTGGPAGVVGSTHFIQSVSITLTHSWASDLDITLTNGNVSIDLSSDNGGSTGLDSEATLVFTDLSANDVDDWNSNAPLADYQAEGGLLNDVFAGSNVNDTWTLNITDDTGGDIGSLANITICFAAIDCQLACPDNVSVDTDSGECGAELTFDVPAIDPTCPQEGLTGECETYESTEDLSFTSQTMLGELEETVVEITGLPDSLPDGIDSIDVTVCANGDFGDNEQELTELSDENGVVDTLGNELAGDCGEFCTVITYSADDYAALAADGTLTFTLSANAAVNPICASQELSASVCIPTVGAYTYELTNDFTGTDDASGLYPVGTTEVTYTLSGGAFPLTCTFEVTVEDNEAPTVNCPSDVVISLDAGECNAVYNFDVNPSDNCGLVYAPTGPVIAAPGAFGSIEACGGTASAVACSGGNTTVVSQLEVSTLPSEVFVNEICFAYDYDSWNLTSGDVRLYCETGTGFPNSIDGDTPVAEGSFSFSSSQSGTIVCVQLNTPYFYDGSCGNLYAEVDADGTGGLVFTGEECNGIVADGTRTYLASTNCGSGTLANFGFDLDAFFGFNYQEVSNTTPGADNPIVSGESLAIGTYDFSVTVEDVNGNTSECAWTVTVNEFPEELQKTSLSCNDLINVSVNADCEAVLTPDDILEGGNYGCYETYNLLIENINPDAVSGNGTNAVSINASALAEFVANGMAGPYNVRAIDPDNGNNYCWGQVMFEDKLAPTLACQDLTLSCEDATDIGALVGAGSHTFSGGEGTVISTSVSEYQVPLTAGFIGPVTALTVDVDITHSWIGDLTIDVVSPSGTSVTLISSQCGSIDDLVATFEDGAPAFDCSAQDVGATYAPEDALSTFYGEAADGEWTVVVSDGAGGDGGVINNITLNIETSGGAIPGGEILDNCAGGEVTYSEVIVQGDCASEYFTQIVRVWSATDAKGNVTPSCTQTISIPRESLSSLTLPSNYDGLPGSLPMLSCDGAGTAWNVLPNGNPSPYPSYNVPGTGVPGGIGQCGSFDVTYTDLLFAICDEACDYNYSSFKVLRKWTVLDWCTGEVIYHNQIIKVLDTEAPTVNSIVIKNRGQYITVTEGETVDIFTDIWGCGASYSIESVDAEDNCSATVATLPANGTIVTVATDSKCTTAEQSVIVTDCCGNADTISFELNIIDNVAPTVVAETSRIISLTNDGIGKIFAESFDDGSHDGCGPIGFAVKRMDNGGQCPGLDKFPPNGDDNKQWNEIVHFCCADATGEPVMVQFMVCDDANCDGEFDFRTNNSKDNCNTSMVEVIVQDKLAPVIVCPAPATVSCVDVAGIDWDNDELVDNMFGGPQAAGTCNVEVTRKTNNQLDCPDQNSDILGFVLRTFTATNAAGTSTCTQKITVLATETATLTCDRIAFDTEAAIFDGLSAKAKRQFGFDDPTQPDPYYGFDSHWCAYNGNESLVDGDGSILTGDVIPALEIDCEAGFAVPELLIDIDGLCTEAGKRYEVDTFFFAGGACKKYIVKYEVIDECIFDENFVNPVTGENDPYHSENGYFTLNLEINAFDTEGPELDCAPLTVEATSCTGIDTPISIGGTDNCTTDQNFWGYQWRVDVGSDNTIDFPLTGWYSTQEATAAQLGLNEWPLGDHTFYWVVSDGCGNTTACSKVVTVTYNEKAPTPYCYDGIATSSMENGEVELWAATYDAGSVGACNGDLTFTMIPEQDAENSTNPYADSEESWVFDCSYIPNGITSQFLVRVYVTDENGNYDYCTVTLRLNDNLGGCDDNGTVTYEVSGKVATETSEGVSNVDVVVGANFPEFPMTEQTDDEGNYSFTTAAGTGALYAGLDYTVTPSLDVDYLNGVTTTDIVLIQKHIMKLELLDSPYKIIAADVNKDCKITGTDIVILRKLLLASYENDDLPQNTSWRFVDQEFTFANPQKPCDFPEATDITNMSADEVDNFVAVKIGDVNATAAANITSANAATRNNESVNFVVEEQAYEAGETYTVDFLAKDFAQIYGYQYTIELSGVEFVSVEGGALNVTEANFGLARASQGIVTTSYDNVYGTSVEDDAVLFTMTVRANANTTASNALNISSKRTPAEAYVGSNLELHGASIEFRTEGGDLSAEKFALFQNEPNPFNGATQIGFELPTASRATLSVYDVTGKVLYTNTKEYAAGYNVETVSRAQLGATGVLYYKLESGDDVATMKMIIIE